MDTAAAQATKRILIVDDDPDVHRFLTVALKDNARHFESAYDGLEGLKKVQEGSWDLVITDVVMSGIDGMELLHRVRSLRPETPVVVMTVDSTPDRIVSAIRGDAFSWFRKPIAVDAVRDVVESALAASPLRQDIEVISASPSWLQLRLRCTLDTAARALRFVREMETGLSENEHEKVTLAFREVLCNAVEHGGRNDPNAWITLSYVRTSRALLFRVRDPGPGFSFDELPHAATSNSPDAPAEHALNRAELGLRPGGFGILLTRALVDELLYNEKGNEALLVKYLDTPDKPA